METALATLIIVAVVLFGALTLAHTYLSVQDQILESWHAMVERTDERSRTSLLPVGAEAVGAGDVVEITIRNDGNVKLADFTRWDVIVEHSAAGAHRVAWYPYGGTTGPADNQWTVMGIYRDALRGMPEAYEPGILNPGEEVVIQVRVSPPVMEGSTNVATVSTPSGISASAVFAWPEP
jgi:hypothetical protein